jgi:hypothetical protein
MQKDSLIPRSERASPEQIAADVAAIRLLIEERRVDHLPNTAELAIELKYERGFCSAALIESQVVSKTVLNKAVWNFRRHRACGKMGRDSSLYLNEILDLEDWINLRILRHDQPTVSAIQAKVYSFFHEICSILTYFRFAGLQNYERQSPSQWTGNKAISRLGSKLHKKQSRI